MEINGQLTNQKRLLFGHIKKHIFSNSVKPEFSLKKAILDLVFLSNLTYLEHNNI